MQLTSTTIGSGSRHVGLVHGLGGSGATCAKKQFDARMTVGVFRDVAFHPITAEAPAVPSTIVLSDQSAAVLPGPLAARLEQHGWQLRRIPGVHHDMQLEAPTAPSLRSRTCYSPLPSRHPPVRAEPLRSIRQR